MLGKMALFDDGETSYQFTRWMKRMKRSAALDLFNADDYERLAEALRTPDRLYQFTRFYHGRSSDVFNLLTPKQRMYGTITGENVRSALLAEEKRFQKEYPMTRDGETSRLTLDDVLEAAQNLSEMDKNMPMVDDLIEEILQEKFLETQNYRMNSNSNEEVKSSSRSRIQMMKILEKM
jgi:hypothetical protein